MWQLEIKTWARESGGPGSGLFMSRDGGTTWTRLVGHGLPESPDRPDRRRDRTEQPEPRVRADRDSRQRRVVATDDGGENWTLVSRETWLNRRPHYYSRLAVLPDNQNEVYFLTQMQLRLSIDGGATAGTVPEIWPDNHDMWIDPRNADRLIVANDRYVNISTTAAGRGCAPASQLRRCITCQPTTVYPISSTATDRMARRTADRAIACRASRSCRATGMGRRVGERVDVVDPADPNMVWTTGQAGFLQHLI